MAFSAVAPLHPVPGLVDGSLRPPGYSVLGLCAGYAGRRVDGFVMRAMDAVLSFRPSRTCRPS